MSTGSRSRRFQAGEKAHGFSAVRAVGVRELRAVACEFRHDATGARVMHISADDEENLFSICFPTPPEDNTGVPHILEHCVLSGSKRFPVRDPFFEMVKMSMATFINAMTDLDRTYYPVASNVRKDLFNLADVYFDAVFHPFLTEDTFKREGHHLLPPPKDRPDGTVSVSGVVYSEMSGAFSHPETRLCYRMQHLLMPNSTYGWNSGGIPESIMDLSYDAFKRFYDTHYHPSNACFIMYGDIPTEDYLAFLGERLEGFAGSDVAGTIRGQRRWRRPRFAVEGYPVAKGETLADKTYLALAWLAGDARRAADVVSLCMLGVILGGHEGSPLKKALVDSRLGQDVLQLGFDHAGLEGVFSVVMKGSEPDRAEAFLALVEGTLKELADGEIAPDTIESAFHQCTFQNLEIGTGFPLQVMLRVLSSWVYGMPPTSFLRMKKHLADCRKAYEKDPLFFNKLIRGRLLENPHRLMFVLKPDPEFRDRQGAKTAARMKALHDSLDPERMRAVEDDARRLEIGAATPNSEEAIASLPHLCVGDLSAKPRCIPTEEVRIGAGTTLLLNDVFSNGVNYLQLDFDLRGLPEALWPFLPRYMDCVEKLGAGNMNYDEMARRKASVTGGIGCWTHFSGRADEPGGSSWGMTLRVKALDEKMDAALDVIRDLMFATNPRDKGRMRDVIVQAFAECRTSMVHSGAHTAALHAARFMSPEAHLAEIVNGLPQLGLMKRLSSGYDSEYEEIAARIEAIRDFLLSAARVTASFTGSGKVAGRVRTAMESWLARMDGGEIRSAPLAGFSAAAGSGVREGLAAPVEVCHCAQVMPALHASNADSALLNIAFHILSMDHVLPEVRFRGNAYGAWCRYDALGGNAQFGSYSDPHIAETLAVFEKSREFVRGRDWTQREIERAVIGVAKGDERPIRPEEATGLALSRHLTGQTRGFREERRDRMMSAKADEVRTALDRALEEGLPGSAICVVADRLKLEETARSAPRYISSVRDIES